MGDRDFSGYIDRAKDTILKSFDSTGSVDTWKALIYGWDTSSSLKQRIVTDSDGHLQVDVLSGGGSVTPPTTLAGGRKTVTTPGTAEAIGSTTSVKRVHVASLTTNTSYVYVGGSDAKATAGSQNGIPLIGGGSWTFEIDDIADVFIDALVAGEGVSFTYEA